jgi:voltage-gated potassium channel
METADRVITHHRAKIIRVLDIAVAIAALATIPVTLAELGGNSNPLILTADWIIWLIFVAEYVVMLRLPPQDGGFFGDRALDRRNLHDWRNWVSIAIIVLSFPPLNYFFQFIRLLRVVRLSRLGRIAAVATRGVGQTFGRRGVLYVAGLVIVAIILGGALIVTVEEPAAVGGADTLSGIWWATVTTVGASLTGRGPETFEGRTIALVLMLCGVAFITTLAGSIAAFFLGKESTVDAIRVQRQLDEIHSAVTGQNGSPRPRSDPGE